MELNSKGLYQSSGKEKESCCLLFLSSTKREISQFHVVVVQRTAEKCTKKRDARVKLLFCFSKPIALLPFSLPSPSWLRKLPTVVLGTLSSAIDLFRIPVNKGIKLRLGWTKYSDLYEIVHPSLDLIFLCLLTAAEWGKGL